MNKLASQAHGKLPPDRPSPRLGGIQRGPYLRRRGTANRPDRIRNRGKLKSGSAGSAGTQPAKPLQSPETCSAVSAKDAVLRVLVPLEELRGLRPRAGALCMDELIILTFERHVSGSLRLLSAWLDCSNLPS